MDAGSLPSPTKVSGKHNAIFEAYYKQVDPKSTGIIEAMDAAKFLKKSGLSDVVLSRIWDLSDPKGRGFLDKQGFFVALKLVSLAQAGSDINIRNILTEAANPPKVGEIPKIIPQAIKSVAPATTDWSMKPDDRIKYEKLFESLQPLNGMIPGNKVKGVLMDSKLPLETLGKIWDLADQDKDGNLDKHEFTVAMHLVYQALDKRAVPTSLPVELQKSKIITTEPLPSAGFGDVGFVANFPSDIEPPPPIPPIPVVMAPIIPQNQKSALDVAFASDFVTNNTSANQMSVEWIVPPADRVRFERVFRESDKDKDGLVSGLEIKNVFLQSGLPQNCLAHIWSLCDTNQSGKLTLGQFILAMWLVEQTKKGSEPPEVLLPNMLPPSTYDHAGASIELSSVVQHTENKPAYSNPELDMASREIDELALERRQLETEIAQKEADIRIKSGEVRSLQSELDTLAATLKQLENQKGEAQKRLDDLKSQVGKIKEQCLKQETTINEQEEELNSKRSELTKLKNEENALQREYEANCSELENLTKQLQDTQLQISQVKAMVTQLLETQRQMNDALLLCKAAVDTGDAVLVSDYSLKIEPDLEIAKQTLNKEKISTKPDPFKDAFGTNNAFPADFNKSSNEFGADTFTGNLASSFTESFSDKNISGFDDAFSPSNFPSNNAKDPFMDGASKTTTSEVTQSGKDDFGSDPFAILHAPTSSDPPPRPESPSPALPPKKSKQPPPRPAPPRPLQGPKTTAATDNFGSSGFGGFAEFDKIFNVMTSQNLNSTTPRVQSQNTTANNATPSAIKTSVVSQNKSALSDFSEDPFKDYRYEDPFDIKDPFADDDNGESSSDVDANLKFPITNNFDDRGENKAANKNVSQKLHADLHSPVNNNFGVFDSLDSKPKPDRLDFFDAFNDNFKKADEKTTTISNQGSFIDPFMVHENTGTVISRKSKESFNESFGDDFFNCNIPEHKEPIEESNFARFEDFYEVVVNDKDNDTKTMKDTRKSTYSVKSTTLDKFASDYSKGESFDEDLQKVLQRSIVDQ